MKIKEIAFISSILLILSCVNEDNEKIAVDVNYRESNLPIITINTYGEEIPDEPRIDAYMGIIDNGNVVNKIDDVFNDYDGKITIEKKEIHLRIKKNLHTDLRLLMVMVRTITSSY